MIVKVTTYCSLIVLLFTSCVEPFDIGEQSFEGALIVEATLTNETRRQSVRLSRTRDFGVVNELDSIYDPAYPVWLQERELEFERNANVRVEDELGNSYIFSETESGSYVSDVEFEVQQGVAYTLRIDTENGESYVSDPESYQHTAEIESVYVERAFNDSGNEGVFVYVDGASTNAQYFRYDFEETYKIIAPEWRKEDFRLTNYDPCALPVPTYDLEIIIRAPDEQRVCYNTRPSEELLQTTTVGLQNNKVGRFPVRFINRNNFIISHRYSILVRQYAQSVDAYNFYEALRSFSASESIFSEVQPGFLEGNITETGSRNRRVLGYFEVTSVSQQRLFFNFNDLFPSESLPTYPISCVPTIRAESHVSYCFTGLRGGSGPLSLIESVNLGLVSYESYDSSNPMFWSTSDRACGDCTLFGSSEIPDFWIE